MHPEKCNVRVSVRVIVRVRVRVRLRVRVFPADFHEMLLFVSQFKC